MRDAGELLIVPNPDQDSSLGYLLRLPIAGGLVFRTAGTWPRTKALFCYPMPPDAWPEHGEVVERVPLRSCVRRGAAIEVVADRARENRSQLVFTTARGRDVVFWQSPRTRKQARPNVALPTARAGGLTDLEIIVDTRERYAYRFAGQAVTTVSRALPCGDYGVVAGGRLVAAVERKSVADLVSSVTNGKAALRPGRPPVPASRRRGGRGPLLGPVQTASRPSCPGGGGPGRIPGPLAHHLSVVFCEMRPLAEEWTYRYLAAAWQWAATEPAAQGRTWTTDPSSSALRNGPIRPSPKSAPGCMGTSSPTLRVGTASEGPSRPGYSRSFRSEESSGRDTHALAVPDPAAVHGLTLLAQTESLA